jgi:hypothetical protein
VPGKGVPGESVPGESVPAEIVSRHSIVCLPWQLQLSLLNQMK